MYRNPGLIPRSLSYIIDGMGTPEFKSRFKDELDHISLEMSFLEDYQNNIYDLLSPTTRSGQSKPSLMARSDMQGVLHVVGLTVALKVMNKQIGEDCEEQSGRGSTD